MFFLFVLFYRALEAPTPEQIVREIAVPITQYLMKELEDSFHCPPALETFKILKLDTIPDNLNELKDYKKVHCVHKKLHLKLIKVLLKVINTCNLDLLVTDWY